MRYYWILILTLISGSVQAKTLLGSDGDIHNNYTLRLGEVYIEHRRHDRLRDPYFPDGKNDWINTSKLSWKLNLFSGAAYWESNLSFRMDSQQVRTGEIEYYLGARIFRYLDFVKYHNSRHMLDDASDRRYPVEDSYGLRLFLKK